MVTPIFEKLENFAEFTPDQMLTRASDLLEFLKSRRTVRHFSDRPVPREVIERCIEIAGRAPSGANIQPWHFVVVSDSKIKKKIRRAAEKEEREFYNGRAPQEWLDKLEHLGTDENKPYLEVAPYLIAIFVERYGLNNEGKKEKHYYTMESVGLATGFLIAALHHVGLASLTHTPSPMNFLNEILNRPENEKPFMLLVVGYPAEDAKVPKISKKPLDQIATFFPPTT